TESLGASLAQRLPAGSVVFLRGELGAGKTTLVRGFLRELGYPGAVKSPTYTLVESYLLEGRRILHFDLYRLADPEELEYMGIRDYFDGGATCFVEWPERGAGVLPAPNLEIRISYREAGRMALISAREDGSILEPPP
ncbi:MAG TPA: tRNA (adenosine(37)-N6)-threonylcarbamoyltransferase complex ATPase subunit type 1 TsaE, partial [Gammaproteobacteria bacterium]|nr:tRNA (adenosine(37)-N6)-threonylcarbamoyltransferase complex ATPase subunit type 1 TsaE [Gammaproteobacteria bacterium]